MRPLLVGSPPFTHMPACLEFPPSNASLPTPAVEFEGWSIRMKTGYPVSSVDLLVSWT